MKVFSMAEYNPFDKEISRLRRSDLDKLISKEIAEGWYVEYKEDFTSSRKTGHSIAAFANSEGGWYIVGVKANQDNVAESIIGFDLATNRGPKEKVRDIIKTHVSPVPFFQSKLLKLPNNKAVLIVYIEKGYETPYVTRDGRIYRRVGEGSDPVPETDRYAMQKLFERSHELKQRIEAFSQNPFSMSNLQAEQRQCFLEAYFYISPFETFRFRDFYRKQFIDELREVFSTPVSFIAAPMTACLSFDNLHTSSRSYVLRHLPQRRTSIDLGLTIELFESGNMKMLIPMPQLPTAFPLDSLPEIYQDSVHYETFLDMLTEDESKFVKVIDGYTFFVSFIILFNQYCRLLKGHKVRKGLKARFRFSESWRTLLYFDDEQYLDFLKEYGLPICLKSEIEILEFNDGRGIPIELEQSSALFSISIMYQALGFPLAFVPESMYGLGKYVVGLSKTAVQQSPLD
jgi:hypothetical protein